MGYWAVARTLVHREPVAARLLQAAGFEIFAPKTKAGPLFPGYLFVRIVDQWRVVDRTVGVLKLVKFGDAPARCPEAEIAKLQARLDGSGFVRLPARPPESARGKISIGAKVRIAGLNAIYVGMSQSERERVLIHLLGRQIVAEVRSGVRPEPVGLVASGRTR
ncbi:MAG: transcription termination/antitermination NusG family protein [Xanthobacteraceae bacterium]